METKTLLIVDDHPIFRAGLKQSVANIPWINVVAEAATGDEAITQIRRYSPDLVTLDIAMPGKDGLKVMEMTREEAHVPLVIIVSSYEDRAYVNRSFELGARAYVLKDSAITDLVECLESVLNNGIYTSLSLGHHKLCLPRLDDDDGSWLEKLTPMERTVLENVARFKTSKEIARQLGLSPRTVQNHRAHICEKLELRGAHQLMGFAVEHLDVLLPS